MRSMYRNATEEAVSVISFISNTLGFINEIQFVKFGTLMERLSFLNVRLNE